MAYELWSQDNFSKGELSPYMYARATTTQYLNGLKTAQNVLNYPTGAAGKRFGTLYQSTIPQTYFSSYQQFYFQTFQYLNECIYQLVFVPSAIYIYLEGILVATVASTGLTDSQVYNLSTTVLQNVFRISGQGIVPQDLTRAGLNSPPSISTIAGNVVTISAADFTANTVLPIQFSTSGTLPTTVPQIGPNITYFAWCTTTTACTVYLTAYDAKFQLNPITFSNSGSGTINVNILNTWTLANSTFKNLPYYDFNGAITSYDALTFTPGAVDGAAVTITVASGYSLLTSVYVGGVFIGGGGTSRITAVASTTSFTVAVQTPFDAANVAIQGSLCILAEPAWSASRGWPQVCSSYQNRALFANTMSLPNGFWASVINEYPNFSDLTNDDDDAIAWFPSSNSVNYIRFVVPYRSITVHTNSGIYSSPLSDIAAITPSNFTLQLQDSTPADVLQPQAIDNQIFILSGNDMHTQLWDGINNAYTSNIVSIANEQVIRTPLDESAYADLHHAGSRYVFVVNESGSLAVYQTLLSEEIAGFTPQIMEQSYGGAQFRQTATSPDGRAWFVVQRQIASAQSPIAISGYTAQVQNVSPASLTATASNLSTTVPTAITFTTSGALPAATPAISTTAYFWAVGLTANTFAVYVNQSDAVTDIAANNGIFPSAIAFTSAGTSSDVVPWPLGTSPIFTLEELTNDTHLDCAVYYNGTAASTITTGPLFNAQDVKMIGDGFGFEATGFGNEVVFNAHGSAVDVSTAYIGFPITTIIEPMPLSMANGPSTKNTTLTKPKHVRTVRFMFNNTIGGTINGVPIALTPLSATPIGSPPVPQNGIFEISVLQGWDDFYNPTYTIEHSEPFNIELLGVFYSVEV